MKKRDEKQQDLENLKADLARVSTVILTTIAKDVPAFRFKAGVVEGRVISIAEIQQLANLPSKDEIISKIMFLLNAPAQRIAMALNALPRNLAVTLSEAIKANKFGSGELVKKMEETLGAPVESSTNSGEEKK